MSSKKKKKKKKKKHTKKKKKKKKKTPPRPPPPRQPDPVISAPRGWGPRPADHVTIGTHQAFQLIGGELRALSSPNRAAFYTSGRASNEAAFLYQLFVRQFGTNNLPDCSNMCHESSGTALVESLGIGKGSVTLSDFEQCDLIVIAGQNPGTNHPRMLTTLQHAKRNGAKIIAINPLAEPGFLRVINPNPEEYSNPISFAAHLLGSGQALADIHLPVRVNGDIALLKGIMKVMLEEEAAGGGVLDHDFIRDHTVGFAELFANLEDTSWQEIVDGCGIPREEIEAAGRMIARSKRMICCWAMGLTQHRDAVATIRMYVNLLLLGGHIGRPGAGTCCVRGHSNVQGDRTMGIWERPRGPFLDAIEKEFGFKPPRKPGYDTVDTIGAMHDGEIDVFIGLGGNFLASSPDTVCTAEAIRRCGLTVHIATKLNRGHLVTGRQALLLPCLGRSERDPAGFLTVEDSFGIISSTRGMLDPASSLLRSEPAIIGGIAAATLAGRSAIDWKGLAADYGKIREHISRVVPGFEDFNSRIDGGKTFYLPNTARERRFVTASGKAQFAVPPISRHDLEADQYLLTTIRSHDQFNTTVYGLHDRYRGVHGGRRVLFMNADDASARGWTRGTARGHHQPFPGAAARGPAVPARALCHSATVRGGLLPRGERAGPGRERRGGEQHADLQIAPRVAGALGGRDSRSGLSPPGLAQAPPERAPGRGAGRGRARGDPPPTARGPGGGMPALGSRLQLPEDLEQHRDDQQRDDR